MKSPNLKLNFKLDLEEWKHLDPKNMGNWPTAPKAAVLIGLFVALLFGGYWFDWSDQLGQLDAAKQKEETLKTTFSESGPQPLPMPYSVTHGSPFSLDRYGTSHTLYKYYFSGHCSFFPDYFC